MDPVKVLLLGSNGQLGRTFLQQGSLSRNYTLYAACRDGQLIEGGKGETGDLADPVGLLRLLATLQPDVIINAAAYTAVDRAEQEESLAHMVNAVAVREIARWAHDHHALVVHYSTDYVFDGQANTPYAVDAPTAPLGAYGRSKLAGEQALAASGASYLNFRTAWVYAAHGQNFLRTMLRLGAERDELRVVADQIGAPTSTDLIVAGTLAALDRWQATPSKLQPALLGTHHLVASGQTTWHGFAQAIFAGAQARGLIARQPTVHAISTAEFPTPAKRPAYSVLDNYGFQASVGMTLPNWKDGLEHVLDSLAQSHPV